MSINPRYTLSDQLSYGSLLLFRCYIYSCRLTYLRDQLLKKKAVHFDRGVFANVICLVIIFTSKPSSSSRILNLIVSVNDHCISVR